MRKRLYISHRRRVLWTGIVLFCLLFQQLAMAAYACTLPPVPPSGIVMTDDCAAMGMSFKAKAPTPHHVSTDPRCAEHCAGNTVSAHDARLPTVPPLLFTTATPALLGTIAQAPDRVALPNTALHRPDPPPTLRFCSLLI